MSHVKRRHHTARDNRRMWNMVLKEARKKLLMSQARTKRLQEIVTDLENWRDTKVPWPGLAFLKTK